MLFAHGAPVTARTLAATLDAGPAEVRRALLWLEARCDLPGSGLRLVRVAGGYQLVTRAEHRDAIERLLAPRRAGSLSHQAMETLSVIAYRQPITMPELNELRGVQSQAVVGTLLRTRLVESRGRKPVVGRPLLYGTTRQFLERFGLDRIEDLPQLKEVGGDEEPGIAVPDEEESTGSDQPEEASRSGDGSAGGELMAEASRSGAGSVGGEPLGEVSRSGEESAGGEPLGEVSRSGEEFAGGEPLEEASRSGEGSVGGEPLETVLRTGAGSAGGDSLGEASQSGAGSAGEEPPEAWSGGEDRIRWVRSDSRS